MLGSDTTGSSQVEGFTLVIVATARAAIPSPLPMNPRASVVVALTFTSASSQRQGARESIPDRPDVWRQGRTLGDDCSIDVRGSPSGFSHPAHRLFEQGQAGYAGQIRVAGGEQGADVSQPGGSEQGVDHGVCQDVSVAVASQPHVMRHRMPLQAPAAVRLPGGGRQRPDRSGSSYGRRSVQLGILTNDPPGHQVLGNFQVLRRRYLNVGIRALKDSDRSADLFNHRGVIRHVL